MSAKINKNGKEYPVGVIPKNYPALNISYDPSNSGLLAITAQGAIDRTKALIGTTFEATRTYVEGERFTYNGIRYKVKTGCTGVTPPNATYYDVVSIDYDITSIVRPSVIPEKTAYPTYTSGYTEGWESQDTVTCYTLENGMRVIDGLFKVTQAVPQSTNIFILPSGYDVISCGYNRQQWMSIKNVSTGVEYTIALYSYVYQWGRTEIPIGTYSIHEVY